jgi:hypothetical protein
LSFIVYTGEHTHCLVRFLSLDGLLHVVDRATRVPSLRTHAISFDLSLVRPRSTRTAPVNIHAMSTEYKSLFSSARCKLQSLVGGGGKDNSSLHRWVLLKNSMIRSHVQPTVSDAVDATAADLDYRPEDEMFEEEHDTFMFPDPHSVPGGDHSAADDGESQWLDSLLEELEDEDDCYFKSEDTTAASQLPNADEETEPLSPLYSPMSSSDDLVESSSYYAYPLPYSPVHPSSAPSWLALENSSDSILPSTPALYDNPLPYLDVDELDDSPVPDAVEDISDDESDAPSTPSVVSTPSLSPPGLSISIPRERTQPLTHLQPQVYTERDDSYFYPFELDPLPFPDDTLAPSLRPYRDSYSEC